MNYNLAHWFLHGTGGNPGYKNLFDKKFFIHVVVGLVLAYAVRMPLSSVATVVLLPMAGILIAISFAYIGLAQGLMQTNELQIVMSCHPGGFKHYAFVFQLSVFVVLSTCVLWSLAGMSIFDSTWPTTQLHFFYAVIKFTLFALSSLTVRESWSIIFGANWMMMARDEVLSAKKEIAETQDVKQ